MSRSVNQVTLIGNVGADPEVRATTNGTKVASFAVATSRQWVTATGEKQERTEWHKCIAWNAKSGGIADIIEKYVKKGDKLYLVGRIEYRQYEDKEQVTKYVTEINVRELLMLGSGRKVTATEEGATPSASDLSNDTLNRVEGDDDLPF